MSSPDEIDSRIVGRLEYQLEGIGRRLGQIEDSLKDISRLQERVNNHDKTLQRYGDKLDHQHERIHEGELWRERHGDKTQIETLIRDMRVELRSISERLDAIEKADSETKGQKDIAKEVFKWATGILTTILIFVITGKS